MIARGVITNPQAPLNALLLDVQSQLILENHHIAIHDMPEAIDLYPRLLERPIPPFQPDPTFTPVPSLATIPQYAEWIADTDCEKYNWVCMIVHTSGSTGLPKTIPWNSRMLIMACAWPWYGEVDLGGVIYGSGLGDNESFGPGVSTQIGTPLTCMSHLFPNEVVSKT